MNYIEYQFTVTPVESWREIVLAYVSNCSFESFIDTDEGFNAYVRKDEEDENCLKAQLQELSDEVKVSYSKKEIEQQNWNAQWESGFQPINVNDKCLIRAEFHDSDPKFEYEVIIQPKMSFGTGHHETTRLMVDYIMETDFEGKDVLDMGCGTGVLGILAKMKKANYVEAIDIDEWSVENSNENAERNGTEINVRLGDADLLGERKFDVILANINRNILLRDIPIYAKNLNFAGSELILSGLMEPDFDEIKKVCEENGLKFVSRKQQNEWIGIKFIID